MNTTSRTTVVGVFRERDEARQAIEALKDAGFDAEDISVLTPDKQTTHDMATETGAQAGSGAATGAVAGGILGGIGGWLIGIGALAIPGVGPFIAAGAFATALGGAALGAGLGAIAGALVGMGVPEDEASYYEGEVRSGRTLVTVRADGRYAEAQGILREYGAYDVESENETAARSEIDGRTETRGEVDRDLLELRTEELQARTTPVQAGEVVISKEVVAEERTLEVPVSHEEVVIDRTPVARRPAEMPIDEHGETISVPVREEKVEVEKRAVVYEEVEVGKVRVTESQSVSDTVRREEARVVREGDVTVRGDLDGDDVDALADADRPRNREDPAR